MRGVDEAAADSVGRLAKAFNDYGQPTCNA